MNDNTSDEDAIDTEALQAQIDLSMSFAQNLVSSWMKDYRGPVNAKKITIENELKEYMRRPPRLGVGAPLPESQSLSRKTQRLKSRLNGSSDDKRSVTGVGTGYDDIKKVESNDEEESRASAIKKRSRIDPFSALQGKRKKTKLNHLKDPLTQISTFPKVHISSQGGTEPIIGQDAADEEDVEKMLSNEVEKSPGGTPDVSPKKKHHNLHESISDVPDANDTLSTPMQKSVIDVPATNTLIGGSPKQRIALSESLLKQPLLNLEGFLSEEGSGDGPDTPAPGASPKKKRRRRKKKRAQSQTHAAIDSSIESMQFRH